MRLKEPIDATKFDIRVLCTGAQESPDAGYVEGVPIDPPDESVGWVLLDLWVEHDNTQEKGDKGVVTTRKTNPAYYQLWAKPKTKAKGKRGRKPKKAVVTVTEAGSSAAAVAAPKPPKPAKTPTVRKPKQKKQAASQEPSEAPPLAESVETTN